MKKVMILANDDIGLYKFRREVVGKLLEQYEVHLVLPYGNFIDEFLKMGCFFHPMEFHGRGKNPIHDLKLLKNYKVIINNIKPDAVLTYTIKPNVYGGIACASLGVPYIANITGLGTAVENGGLLSKITTCLYKYSLRKAHKVFFQNEENLLFMKSKEIVKENYEIIPGSGVNLQQYEALPYPKDDIANFVFVARVMKEKGIDQYLDAAKYFSDKYANVQFHIFGACADEYKDVLEREVSKGCVIYHGIVGDMVPIYEMAACTIHPTYYPEGMSNVLLESCASARPIITTNRPGCKEIVDDNVNGFVCEAQNSEDLIDKIERFLALPLAEREKMGLQGRKKVEQKFDRNIVIEKYLREISHCGWI